MVLMRRQNKPSLPFNKLRRYEKADLLFSFDWILFGFRMHKRTISIIKKDFDCVFVAN
jgi:hypothetical protein